jgi:antitoxin component HigA of HigAB toxin-antitoxin module
MTARSTRKSDSIKDYGPYMALVVDFPLVPIESKEHHKRALAVMRSLIDNDASLSSSQIAYGKTLAMLISAYEDAHYPLDKEGTSGPEMLQYLIGESGKTQAEIARLCGIPRQNISNYLAGTKTLSKPVRRKLCEIFKLKADIFEHSLAQ